MTEPTAIEVSSRRIFHALTTAFHEDVIAEAEFADAYDALRDLVALAKYGADRRRWRQRSASPELLAQVTQLYEAGGIHAVVIELGKSESTCWRLLRLARAVAENREQKGEHEISQISKATPARGRGNRRNGPAAKRAAPEISS